MGPVKSPPKRKAAKVRDVPPIEGIADGSFFGTPEEIAQDNAEWDEIVANTSPEKLQALRRMFEEEMKRGGIMPLDFTDK